MRVIHFTSPAADPLKAFDSTGASFLPLADGEGDTHVSCVHLDPGATISAPSLTHAATLLVVHGRITIASEHGEPRNTKIHAGMGIVVAPNEPYSFKSDSGAILLIVEAEQLLAHKRGISNPERIAGATWPSDSVWAHAAKK
jgi:redox-sensitive bicupin YhaK (pirin superfamily)